MKKKSILLIGFMGAGKTTVGKKLSYKLRMPVEDTDKLIEQRAGVTISEIFWRSFAKGPMRVSIPWAAVRPCGNKTEAF